MSERLSGMGRIALAIGLVCCLQGCLRPMPGAARVEGTSRVAFQAEDPSIRLQEVRIGERALGVAGPEMEVTAGPQAASLQYWKEVEKCSDHGRLCQVITYKGTCLADLRLDPGRSYVAKVSAYTDETYMNVAERDTNLSAGTAHCDLEDIDYRYRMRDSML